MISPFLLAPIALISAATCFIVGYLMIMNPKRILDWAVKSNGETRAEREKKISEIRSFLQCFGLLLLLCGFGGLRVLYLTVSDPNYSEPKRPPSGVVTEPAGH